jgi:hypothetical protein
VGEEDGECPVLLVNRVGHPDAKDAQRLVQGSRACSGVHLCSRGCLCSAEMSVCPLTGASCWC